MLPVVRVTRVGPASDCTGTPIQSASHVVVVPLYGHEASDVRTTAKKKPRGFSIPGADD